MPSLPPSFANDAARPTRDDLKPGRPLQALRAAWGGVRWTLRVALVGVGALWSILLLLWLVLHWGILPHIAQWRAHIEMQASAALGVPVRIGDIQVRSSGWVPSVELTQVVLLDTQQRPALVLPRVVASLSPQSLLAWDLRFQQLYIQGAQLEVRRDPRGRVFVAGFDLDSGQASTEDDGAALRWFLKQPEFVIDGGALRWVDEQRGAPPLALTDLRLVMRNTLRRHAIQLDATPPPGWGERFSVMGRFTQPLLRGEDFKRWSGTVHANLPRADVRELKRYLTLPVDVTEGDGALRAWVDLREGEPVAATVDLALRAVTAQLTRSTQPLALAQIEGRISAKRHKDGVDVDVRQLSFQTGDGLSWPRGDLQLGWRQREGGPTTAGQFNAQQLDIGVMAEVASALPLGEPVRKLLADVRPQGLISSLALSFDGAPDAPTAYRVNGEVSRLSLASRPAADATHIGRPGLQNADVQFKASERGGEAQVRMAKGQWSFPGVFDEPDVALDEFSAKLIWEIDPVKDGGRAGGRPPRLGLQVKDARFANPDAEGTLSGSWSTGPGEGLARGGRFPGQLTLDGQLTRGDAVRTARYLPRGIAAPVRAYVARAVRGGTIGRTTFRIKGDVWDFPYWDARHARDAEFRIAARVDDLALAYLPSVPAGPGEPGYDSPWPALAKVSGELVFDRSAMEIRRGQARLGAVELTQINGGIANLASKSVLALTGVANGPLTDMVRFVNTTPVGDWMGQSLAQTTATGPAELKLALNLPLWDGTLSTVKGSLTLPGNDLRIQPDTLPMGNVRGRVDFTERGFTVAGATARVLGGDASFDGGTQPDGSLRFNGQGVATADGLRRAGELGLVARVATVLSGQTSYRVALGFVRGQPEVTVTSNLVGLGADLPQPLRKAAEVTLPFRYQTALAPDTGNGTAQALRDTLRLDLGTLVQAQYLREYPRDATRDGPRVLRGGIGVNERAPTPANGVAAHVSLAQADADAWQAVAARLLGSGDDLASAPGGYGPQAVALRAQQLTFMERQLGRVVAGLSEDNGNWRVNLDADELAGYLEYRPARRGTSAAAAGRVYARLGRLSLPKRELERVETLLQQPTSVPALDIVVDDLELRGKKLGRVEVDAINRADGPGGLREWQLRRLALTVPEARLVASGSWRPGGVGVARQRSGSVMDFKLELADSGAFLERLGTGRAIRGGKGTLAGQVSWLGSPLDLDYASLSGQVNLAVASGQFLKAEPGAARLLGVLSLQALPRRLALDFRDVFQQGFAFDSITGDVDVAQGVARTNNLLMRGVQAAVLMEGQASVQDETQDLRVVVVPEINAGTASLAYAAINPAVGLGTFLAQLVLRKPLVQAGTREFHVTGPWADPKVERVERKLTDPVPEFDAAPAAPSPAASDPATSAPATSAATAPAPVRAPPTPAEPRR